MHKTSFTMDIIPSAGEDGTSMVYIKRLDVKNGVWGPVTYLLEERMHIDMTDVPEADIPWTAVDVFQRILRLYVSKLNQPLSEHK